MLGNMQTHERERGRNFIGILDNQIEEQRALESLQKSDRLMRNYLRRLMAAMLKQPSGTG
jgi:hypothetical protein